MRRRKMLRESSMKPIENIWRRIGITAMHGSG